MNNYMRSLLNLQKMGVTMRQAQGATNIAAGYMRALHYAPQYLTEIGKELEGTASFIGEYNPNNILVGEPQVVGITGMPGTGKTTLLSMLRDDGEEVLDEFWSQDRDYEQKKDILQRLVRNDKKVYIAACQIDYPVDLRIHMVCDPMQRLENLQQRRRDDTDLLRIKHFDSFNMYDHVVFESERVHAHLMQSHKF